MENSLDEMNKINQVRPYISTNDLANLNEQIYGGVRLEKLSKE